MINNLTSYFRFEQSRVVGMVFGINSFMFGNWAARIPDLKERLMLSESDLGLALLGLPVGAIIMMPFMGYFIKRIGSGRMSILLVMAYSISIILPVMAQNLILLILSLILVGALHGSTDIAMNAAAVAVEKKYHLHIMSTSHGMWSLGSMIGAGIGALFAHFGVLQPIHMLIAAIFMLLVGLYIYKPLIAIQNETYEGSGFALPRGPIIGLAIITFLVLIAEGAVADWSAVFIREVKMSNKLLAGFGYAGFSLSMTLGRLYGDAILPKYGSRSVMIWCTLISTLGLIVPIITSSPWLSILGFTLSGFGFSLIVPIIFKGAANIKHIDPGTGLAMVATLGYVGFLIGPPFIGFISEEISLTAGIAFINLITFIVFLFSLTRKKI